MKRKYVKPTGEVVRLKTALLASSATINRYDGSDNGKTIGNGGTYEGDEEPSNRFKGGNFWDD